MCLSIALGVMSTVATAMAQNEAAKRQNQAYQQNALNANADAVEKYAQNQMQQIQEEAKAARERLMNKEETIKAKGTAAAGAQNEGSSVNAVMHDLERQGARHDDVTGVNLKNAKAQANANKASIKNEAQNRINSMSTAEGPSLIQTAISGLGNIAPYVGGDKIKGKDHGGTTTP